MALPFALGALAVGVGRFAVGAAARFGIGKAAQAVGSRAGGTAIRGLTSAMRSHHAKQQQADAHDRKINNLNQKLWVAQSGLGLMHELAGAWRSANAMFPFFAHTISVSVQGGPEADLRRVWYLTLAAAFGRYRNRVRGFQGVDLEAVWDVTGKACSVTIAYENSGLWGAAINNAPGITGALQLIQQGPDQVTVGGSWPTFTTALGQQFQSATGQSSFKVIGGILFPGATAFTWAVDRLRTAMQGTNRSGSSGTTTSSPSTAQAFNITNICNPTQPVPLHIFGGWAGRRADIFREVIRNDGFGSYSMPFRRVTPGAVAGDNDTTSLSQGKLPILPDDGRVITTGERFNPRVQNPKPPIDGMTRSSLLALVAQGLSQPCYLPPSPPCTLTPLGSSGLQVYPPGGGTEAETYNGSIRLAIDKFAIDVAMPLLDSAENGLFRPGFVGPDGYPVPLNAHQLPNIKG